jgi:ABC-2 type transport system permease protein
MNTTKKIRSQNIIQLLTVIIAVVGINIVGQFYFGRFDLTSEKRFSVAPETKDIIENIDDYIFIKVPPTFR